MQTIKEAVECVLEFIQSIPLSKSSIKQYRIHLRSSIIPYCETNRFSSFLDGEMQAYTEEQLTRYKNGEFSKSTMKHRRRAAALLADCMHGRKLIWAHKYFNQKTHCLCNYYEGILANYRTHLAQFLAPRNIRRHIGIIKQFHVFIEQNNIYL